MGRLIVLAAAGFAAGCTPRDVMVQPVAANGSDASVVTIQEPGDPQTQGQIKTADGYPSFATPLTAASAQMTNEDANALGAKLSALSRARQSGAVSEAEYQRRVAELRKLAADNAAAGN